MFLKRLAISLLLAALFIIMPGSSGAQTSDDIQSEITALQARLLALQSQLAVIQEEQKGSEIWDRDAVQTIVTLKVRSGPSMSATVIGQVPSGITGVIACNSTSTATRHVCPVLAGPFKWWYVKWDSSRTRDTLSGQTSSVPSSIFSGLEGWSADGTSEARFLTRSASVSSAPNGSSTQNSGPATAPHLIDIVPAWGPAGEAYPLRITIRGTSFMPTGNIIKFGPVKIPDVPSSEAGRITIFIPKSLPSKSEVPPLDLPPGEYPVTVTNTGGTSNALTFTLTAGP